MAKRKQSLYARMQSQMSRDVRVPDAWTRTAIYGVAWFSGYRAGQRDEQAKAKRLIDMAHDAAAKIGEPKKARKA